MSQRDTPRPLMLPTEVAEYLGVPAGTLQQWRYLGSGPRYFKIGRYVRYDFADVQAWRDSQEGHSKFA